MPGHLDEQYSLLCPIVGKWLVVFELLSVVLTILAAGLFYLSAPSQCLIRRSLSLRAAVVPGLLSLLAAVEVMALRMHLLTALLIVGTVLMLACSLLPLALALFRPQGRSS